MRSDAGSTFLRCGTAPVELFQGIAQGAVLFWCVFGRVPRRFGCRYVPLPSRFLVVLRISPRLLPDSCPRSSFAVDIHVVAEIVAAGLRMVDHLTWMTVAQDRSVANHITPVGDLQRFANTVIGDQNRDSA